LKRDGGTRFARTALPEPIDAAFDFADAGWDNCRAAARPTDRYDTVLIQ